MPSIEEMENAFRGAPAAAATAAFASSRVMGAHRANPFLDCAKRQELANMWE